MSRDDGFSIADIDSSYFDDAKLKELWRRLRNEDAMARAVCLHLSALLASWRQGERVSIDNAAPLWLDDKGGELAAILHDLDLIDLDGMLPEDSFGRWFGAAVNRRAARREAGRAGGLASAQRRSSKRSPKVKQPSTLAEPDRPSVRPSVRPTASDAREGLPNLDSGVSHFWEEATGRSVLASGSYAAEYLDDACRRHPPSEVGAAIIRARQTFDHIPDAASMVSAMRPILDPLPDRKAASAKDREAEERAASRKRTAATLRRTHALGAHAAEPHPNCPSCNEGDAA